MRAYLAVPIAIAVCTLALADDTPKTKSDSSQFPGPTAEGFLLPNGWRLTPVGRHVVTTDLPLNIVPLQDNRHALIASSGYNSHDLALVDLSAEPKIISKSAVRQSWFGLVVSKDESKVCWAGGGDGRVHTFDLKENKLTGHGLGDVDLSGKTLEEIVKNNPEAAKMTAEQLIRALPNVTDAKTFKSGLALDEKKNILYSLDINAGSLSVVSLNNRRQVERTEVIGGRPYGIAIDPSGHLRYVSDWAGKQVMVLDRGTLKVIKRIGVGDHPNQMAIHSKDSRLFVACASSNCISVIDTKRGQVSE